MIQATVLSCRAASCSIMALISGSTRNPIISDFFVFTNEYCKHFLEKNNNNRLTLSVINVIFDNIKRSDMKYNYEDSRTSWCVD